MHFACSGMKSRHFPRRIQTSLGDRASLSGDKNDATRATDFTGACGKARVGNGCDMRFPLGVFGVDHPLPQGAKGANHAPENPQPLPRAALPEPRAGAPKADLEGGALKRKRGMHI